MQQTRRQFLQSSAASSVLGTGLLTKATFADEKKRTLANEVGITTSSVGTQLSGRSANGKFTLLELPKLLREELDMRVIDLNTSSLASTKAAYLDKVRKAADEAGCVLTNLKMNQRDLNMDSANKAIREKALEEYKKSIDVASYLGLRWARPLPRNERPDRKIHVSSYRELADYAADKNVEMLVENFAWMQDDPESVVKLIKEIGANVAACPDTGNWNSDEIRFKGLEKTFPIAVTCDYKARQLGPNGEHALYDLEKCFSIGWKAGFRGPWCLEHANNDTKTLLKELALLRDMLRGWMKEQA